MQHTVTLQQADTLLELASIAVKIGLPEQSLECLADARAKLAPLTTPPPLSFSEQLIPLGALPSIHCVLWLLLSDSSKVIRCWPHGIWPVSAVTGAFPEPRAADSHFPTYRAMHPRASCDRCLHAQTKGPDLHIECLHHPGERIPLEKGDVTTCDHFRSRELIRSLRVVCAQCGRSINKEQECPCGSRTCALTSQ